MCVYNFVKSLLLLSQALVCAVTLDSACQPVAAICQNQCFSLGWTASGVTGGWRSLQDHNGVWLNHDCCLKHM